MLCPAFLILLLLVAQSISEIDRKRFEEIKSCHDSSEQISGEARQLQIDITATRHNLHDRFANLRIAHLSSPIYGGYAATPLNPEPYAYEGGFAVKWTVDAKVSGRADLNFDPSKGAVRSPWIARGPYLWSDGLKGGKQDTVVYAHEILTPTARIRPARASGRSRGSCWIS